MDTVQNPKERITIRKDWDVDPKYFLNKFNYGGGYRTERYKVDHNDWLEYSLTIAQGPIERNTVIAIFEFFWPPERVDTYIEADWYLKVNEITLRREYTWKHAGFTPSSYLCHETDLMDAIKDGIKIQLDLILQIQNKAIINRKRTRSPNDDKQISDLRGKIKRCEEDINYLEKYMKFGNLSKSDIDERFNKCANELRSFVENLLKEFTLPELVNELLASEKIFKLCCLCKHYWPDMTSEMIDAEIIKSYRSTRASWKDKFNRRLKTMKSFAFHDGNYYECRQRSDGIYHYKSKESKEWKGVSKLGDEVIIGKDDKFFLVKNSENPFCLFEKNIPMTFFNASS